MLKIRNILIILFLVLGKLGNAQTFNVSIDTMFVDIKDIAKPASIIDLTHAVKFDDKYYCFLREEGLYGGYYPIRHFLIISDNGEILNNIEVPKDIRFTVYFDFFIRNGRLFAKTYMDHNSFEFDLNKLKWIKIKEIDDRVYEDSNYVISYLSFGEWGKTTWFIDKQTKKQYIIGVDGTCVSKIEGNYYLTGPTSVHKIESPKHLKRSSRGYYYNKVEKRRKFYEGIVSLLGSHAIYEDTSNNLWMFEDPHIIISTSFIADNNLYHLYSDSIQTYIGKIENKRLIPVQNFGKRYQFFNWHYSYRGKNLENYGRFLKFREDNNTYGFAEINNNMVDIIYLRHNQDSLEYVGSDQFSNLFKMLLNKQDSFSLEMVDSFEIVSNGVDLKDYKTDVSRNHFYPRKYLAQEISTKSFIKVENKYIMQETEYLYTLQDNLVKSMFFQWSETKQYKKSNSFKFLIEDKEEEFAQQFILKMREIEKIITENTNISPLREDRENDHVRLTWSLPNGMKIKLYGLKTFKSYREIRMIIDL